jgi:hypothetical protein
VRSLLKLVAGFIASTSPLAPSWALWSIFIAGCCTERESNRIAVMDIFNTAIKITRRPVSVPSLCHVLLCKSDISYYLAPSMVRDLQMHTRGLADVVFCIYQNLVSAFRVVQAVWRHRDLQADVTDVCVRTISRGKQREKQARGCQARLSGSKGAPECVYEWQSVMEIIGERISPV